MVARQACIVGMTHSSLIDARRGRATMNVIDSAMSAATSGSLFLSTESVAFTLSLLCETG